MAKANLLTKLVFTVSLCFCSPAYANFCNEFNSSEGKRFVAEKAQEYEDHNQLGASNPSLLNERYYNAVTCLTLNEVVGRIGFYAKQLEKAQKLCGYDISRDMAWTKQGLALYSQEERSLCS